MIAIVKWELSRRRMYLLWWSLSIAVLVVLLMLIYPSIHQQAAQLDQVMKQLPESVRALRGGDTDLTSPIGYLNAELFYITLPLLLIIMAVGLGGSLLAKDEQEHTLELVLARPVSRGSVLFAKALSGLVIIAIVGIVASAATVLMAKAVSMDIAMRNVLLTGICTTIFAASFGAITFALSAASLLSRRLAVAIAVLASFGGYLLESLSGVSDYIKTPAKLLPYHYFTPHELLAGSVPRGLVFYMLGIFAAAIVISYLGFRRRDLA